MHLSRRPHLAWLLAVVVVAALVFAACAPRVRQSGGNSGGYAGGYGGTPTSTSSGTTTQDPNVQSVQTTDQAIQNALQSLQSVQNDANTDFSSQDTQTVP